nr:MAG TPA_asm: helix-turn-helix domain protein [Caudoviricetes sp.]
MELTLEQKKAKSLYAQGKSAIEIAKILNIGKSTIYRWISNDELGFKESKKMASFDAGDMAGIIDESHKKLLIEISENPDKLLDPKTADALLKVSKVLESLGQRKEKEDLDKQTEEEVRGVLIIDDITYENLKKTTKKTVTVDEQELP